MSSRYSSRIIGLNNSEEYKEMFRERGVKFIRQYATPSLRYPTAQEIAKLTLVSRIWGSEDRLWKLASIHYGDPTKAWIIAFFNRKPTEAHIEIGDTILVPVPLGTLLEFMGI